MQAIPAPCTQAIPAPCPQVAEDEFLPQHIDLRICEWLCSSKLHRCHNPQSPPKAIPAPCPQLAEDEFLPQHIDLRRFRLHARKLLRMSFYRSTLTSASFSLRVFSAMAKEFVNGFVHQNGIAVITRNPPKGDSGSMPASC
ncbi:hypothetical protein JHK82_027792 [Glycine max]|nr:hypothetical protein JHK82_027792 [Glycine max]